MGPVCLYSWDCAIGHGGGEDGDRGRCHIDMA